MPLTSGRFAWRGAMALVLVAVVAACSYRTNLSELALPPERSRHLGFSLVPLDEKGWMVLARQPRGLVLAKRGADPDESFALQANIVGLPRYPSVEEFYAAARTAPAPGGTPGRFRIVLHESRPAVERGAQCARMRTLTEDHAPARTTKRTDSMLLEVFTLLCLHHGNATVGVSVAYSQRYYSGNRSPTLEKDADAILGSVVLADL